MALTIESQTTESIGLDEYLDYVAENVDLTDVDQIVASSDKLKALSNNRTFLVDKFNKELGNWESFQSDNSYSSQTFILGQGKKFFVRANIWLPTSNPGGVEDWERRLFAYSMPHDHNFSFLTVGYMGSGYKTTIYEYDPHSICGRVNEKVSLSFLENTTLPEGKIMFYRASRDIHNQLPPEDFSISINLMFVSPEITRDQYWFDLEQGVIAGRVQNSGSSRKMLCKLAKYIGDEQTVSILSGIAEAHFFPSVRLSAYDALSALLPQEAERVWKQASSDRSDLVSEYGWYNLGQID